MPLVVYEPLIFYTFPYYSCTTHSVSSISTALPEIPFKSTLHFYLNGKPKIVKKPDPEAILIDYIRNSAHLAGTKLGCAEGGCGACTVTVAEFDHDLKRVTYKALNSCIVPLISVEGKHLITVEGIGQLENDSLHPTQERIAKFHGSQCGFCTPGIVMSLYSLLRNNSTPSKEQISEAFDGNLCRCTGYMPIIDAAYTFAIENQPECGSQPGCAKVNCCRNGKSAAEVVKQVADFKLEAVCAKGVDCCRNKPESNGTAHSNETDMNALFTPNGLPLKPYAPQLDLPFPKVLQSREATPVLYGNGHKMWIKPTTKQQLLEILYVYPHAKLVGGASEVQVEVKLKNADYKLNVYCNDIAELKSWKFTNGGLEIGANISLSDLEMICENLAHTMGHAGQIYGALAQQFKFFAGRQIRNAATPAGAIVTASPISDLNPILVAGGCHLIVESFAGNVKTFALRDFFVGYRKTLLEPGYIITKIFIPQTAPGAFIHAYKQSKRKDDDIAIVTACLQVELDDARIVKDACLVYGGMAALTVESPKAQAFLRDRKFDEKATLEGTFHHLELDFPLGFGVPGGMASYRKTLTLSFFYKFFNYVLQSLEMPFEADSLAEVTRGKPEGKRDIVNPFETEIVGKSNPHLAALRQVTGEAVYASDISPQFNELCAIPVLLTKAHAKILSVDWLAALEVDTVEGYLDINDLPSKLANLWGVNPAGMEEFFADTHVYYYGQTIGVVLATDPERAREAARLVKVEYEDLTAVISIEDAIDQSSYFADNRVTEKGDWEAAFAGSKHVFENTSRIGAQEHFYFETQGCLVIPEEDGELKVYASTQNPTETQEYAAHITGVPSSKVVVRVKRLGGGFGGKETRSVCWSSLAALGAKKFKRPVRMFLSRSDDMLVAGQRHPFLMKWKIGLDESLRFTGLDATLYANAGWSMDLTRGVVDRAVFHAANAYHIPNARLEGIPCKTNTASNTAFRGFGGPQGMFMAETIVVDVAERLGVDPDLIRERNYYDLAAGQTTTYKQLVSDDYSVPDIVAQNKEEANFDGLRNEISEFNRNHKWVKRGLAHVPTMFGIAFGVTFLNQGGALIHIHQDGSVLVSHGGTEMGQGLHTKMAMIAAEELNVPLLGVFISETSTQSVANTSATAASASSDLNGMAVKDACDQLNERLRPIREKLGPGASMANIAKTAYLERVNLSANGFYKTPDIGYEWGVPNPKPAFSYYTQGSAICTVEVDTLTGDWTCLEAHVKMDIGRPINQAIDYGQIEGAFVQGMGLFTLEQSLWLRHNGALFTRGPGAYKIPGFRDVPQVFNISMLKNRDFKHLKTIRRSKGIGEPPLFLGCCVLFAIRNALDAARREHGIAGGSRGLPLISPLTTDRIRGFVGDTISGYGEVVPKDGERDFFVEA
ncbi:hypothetical protein BABINDRAFT_169836 [Babjeviella inositovora NRRL Y-12698]|uniref:Xanthine dehydrogenase n=1 Tax=Babjeviella inositovora NRRL Y-12698 TaxID=984486 RepID=A0A1E3QYA4_9ASCO|nr:uncharacterized protein BABINDRAFT_169836 [Babjeviella inositovora NRRL Y-12698]ODQ82586.1 hypothetical protein BABINDRAFT_169836 [Babjeviella inositovora NRRL Y-12698]